MGRIGDVARMEMTLGALACTGAIIARISVQPATAQPGSNGALPALRSRYRIAG
jgi:hypothetical protein